MSQIMQTVRIFGPDKLHCSGLGSGQPGENAQQGRFARAVRPAQLQRFARSDLEGHALEQEAQAPRRGEIAHFKDQ